MKKVYLLVIGLLAVSLLVGGCDFLKSKTATAGKAFEIYTGEVKVAIPTHFDVCATVDTPDNLIHYWAFEEDYGDKVYDSVGNNQGVLKIKGTPTPPLASLPVGQVGLSLKLNGAEWVDIDDLNLKSDFTIQFWASVHGKHYGEKINNQDAIIGQEGIGQDLNFYQGKLRLWGPGDRIIAKTQIKDSEWNNWAITRFGSQLKLYRNGQLESTGNWAGALTPKAIGRGNAGFFHGEIDELAIYDQSLTQSEINKNYQNGKKGINYCNNDIGTFSSIPEGAHAMTEKEIAEAFENEPDALGGDDSDGSTSLRA